MKLALYPGLLTPVSTATNAGARRPEYEARVKYLLGSPSCCGRPKVGGQSVHKASIVPGMGEGEMKHELLLLSGPPSSHIPR